ncbi:Mitogen-activated protein kinase kinase [Bertholletia excelsa]
MNSLLRNATETTGTAAILNDMTSVPASADRHGYRHRRSPELNLSIPERDLSSISSSPCRPAAQLQPPPPSFNLSELQILNRTGSDGSNNTLYKVVHQAGNFYALKVVSYGGNENIRRQILRQLSILFGLDHPNVIKCHGVLDKADSGEIQILLNYMDGSLEGVHVPEETSIATLARQILPGLSYFHERKFVHGDVKPFNLLVDTLMQEVKLTEFGLSRIITQTAGPWGLSMIGYLSPERINTDLNWGMYDGCSGDIWGLGLSLLQIYMGRYPFIDSIERLDDVARILFVICMWEPPAPPVTASRDFRDFISCCLRGDPAKRWTASQLLGHPFILRSTSHAVAGASTVQE